MPGEDVTRKRQHDDRTHNGCKRTNLRETIHSASRQDRREEDGHESQAVIRSKREWRDLMEELTEKGPIHRQQERHQHDDKEQAVAARGTGKKSQRQKSQRDETEVEGGDHDVVHVPAPVAERGIAEAVGVEHDPQRRRRKNDGVSYARSQRNESLAVKHFFENRKENRCSQTRAGKSTA